MSFRKLMMLAGIGGLVYAHRKRGGEMTLESFKESGRKLIDAAKTRANDLRSQGRRQDRADRQRHPGRSLRRRRDRLRKQWLRLQALEPDSLS